MSLNCSYTLGRSGLQGSHLALGTMTYWYRMGWGADEDMARQLLFNTYVDFQTELRAWMSAIESLTNPKH